jgi:hypothetical protein
MKGNIPIPAEVARQMATEAADNIHQHRENGYKATASRLSQAVSEALEASADKDGEYVSLHATTVSKLAAASTTDVPSYAQAARVYLEQYGVW